MIKQHSNKVPENMQALYDKITDQTNQYCKERLNEEYAELVRHVVASLARKRPSPLIQGTINSWACSVIHAVGMINFLFDKSLKPYVSSADLAQSFNLSQSTVNSKSKQIRELLKMSQFDHHWLIASRKKDSPMAWIVSVNSFIIDARTLPLKMQQEAYERGLIPNPNIKYV